MPKIKLFEGVTSVSHEGVQYDADEDGVIEVDGAAQPRHVAHFRDLGFEVLADEESQPAVEGEDQGDGHGEGDADEQSEGGETASDANAGETVAQNVSRKFRRNRR